MICCHLQGLRPRSPPLHAPPPSPPPTCSKLKAVLAAPKRFPGKAPKQALPADLADMTVSELLAALVPVLPALRHHLDAGAGDVGPHPGLPLLLLLLLGGAAVVPQAC